MTKEKIRKPILAAVLVLLAVLCIFWLSRYMSAPSTYAKTIEYLDEKKTTVMELTAASTAASAAITLLPGDTATPIAEKLADLSSYFLIVLCAVYLEKYLVTIVGYAAFTYILPAACLLFAASLFWRWGAVRAVAKKLAVLGLAMALVIPAGVKVSHMIEDIYSASIQETLTAAESATQEIETADDETKKDQNVIEGFISSIGDQAKEAVAGFERVLNRFIEALAVMLVTSCLIPVLVLLFFIGLVKTVLGIDGHGFHREERP